MKKWFFFLIFISLLPNIIFGQKNEGLLFGRITDENGKSIEFVNVAVLNTQYGVVSDSRGNYSLQMPADTLMEVVFSFIGYEEQSYKIKLKDGDKIRKDVTLNVISTILPDAMVQDKAIKTSTITRLDARETVLLPTSGAGGGYGQDAARR